MADEPKPTSSVTTTAATAGATTSSLVIVQWLVQPEWPPSTAVLTVAMGLIAPIAHLIGREIMQRLQRWSERDDPPPSSILGPDTSF